MEKTMPANLHELEELQIWLDQSQLNFTLNPNDEATIYRLLAFLAERKWFNLVQECPRCQSPHFCNNGVYHTVFHRHKCLDCGKKFNDLTGTPFSWIHKPAAALRYITQHLQTSKSNVKIAKNIDVSKNTISKWKKKFN